MTEEDLAKAEEWKKRVAFKDKEYWATHQKLKLQLLNFVRDKARAQRLRNGATPGEIRATDQLFDPKALTIGFARRFATYKRAALLFRDLDKLAEIVNDPERPVQFEGIESLPKRVLVMKADVGLIKAYISQHCD